MTTLTADTLANPGCLADLIREPVRHLDELRDIPDLHDQHREALAAIPTPKAPDQAA